MMRKWLLLLMLTWIAYSFAWAGDGYQIRVKINGYQNDTLYLAYHFGDKQYIKDTIIRNSTGDFIFEGDKKLESGVYLVVMAPKNQYFQVLVTDQEQKFTLSTDFAQPVEKAKFEGSKDNSLFYEYISYLNKHRPEADSLRAQIDRAGADAKKKEKLQAQLDKLNSDVVEMQQAIVKEHPQTLTAAIIKANQSLDVPEFPGIDSTQAQLKRWRFMQDHYFDNLDVADPRMLRTPFLFQRVDYYVNKLQVTHPDSIARSVDYVLDKMRPSEETFKFYLIHFLNQFAKANIVGMDAVYVHLVDRYYASGLAPWTEQDQLTKILESARTLKPLLIGKIAPNIDLQKRDGSKISLHGVDAEYTILYFWRYDCGVCKKSTPFLKTFYEKFKDKDVKIMAVCVKFTDEVPKCWEYVDENGTQDWLHCADPYNVSRFSSIYDTRSTPLIFVLDRDKKILSKRIGAEQLEDVVNKMMEMKAKEKAGGSSQK